MIRPPDGEELQGWELRPRGAFVSLEEDGVSIFLRGVRRRGLRIPYASLTHVDLTARGVWLATRRTTLLLRRRRFEDPEGGEAFARALVRRIGVLPGGRAQLDRMRALGERTAARPRRWVTLGVVAICLGVFALQFTDPLTLDAGAFVPLLVGHGELWRIATGNFLHGVAFFPVHLLVNLLCLLGFGWLVERPLGSLRAGLVLGAGGAGAMLGSALAGYPEVIGASGLVAGLAGAILALELHLPEQLPASWRLPRRLFVTVLILQVVVDMMLPFVAAAAHLGGFVAGYLAARLLASPALEGRPPGLALRASAAALVLAVGLSFASAGAIVLREAAALERHGRRLLAVSEVTPLRLNDLAWRMVTEIDTRPTTAQLDLAAELATRAVEETERADPDILDTLAEVLFARGDETAAIDVIDEAIHLTGGETYFREQRRRFTGERDSADRPDPPTLPWSFRKPPEAEVEADFEEGLTI